MNRILSGLGLLILLSCSAADDPEPESNIWIKGRLLGTLADSVTLLDAYDFPVVSSHLDEDNKFSLAFNATSGAYYQLKYGNSAIPIYLSPQYDLILKISEQSKEDLLEFEGRGKESNNYILSFSEFESVNKPAYDLLLAKSESEFLIEARRYRSKSEAFLRNYQEHHFNLDPNFIAKERARILYAWANRLIHYPEAHIYYTGEDEFAVSDTYHDYKKTVNLDASELITLPEYQRFIKAYLDAEANILQEKGDKRRRTLIRFDLSNQLISEPQVKDFAQFDILKESLQTGLDESNKQILKSFMNSAQNGMMRAAISDLVSRWEVLERGNQIPSLPAKTIDATPFDIASYQGKFIYLRFWTTWCQPCLNDTTQLRHLKETEGNEDLVIISVNLDLEKADWKAEMENRQGSADIIHLKVAPEDVDRVKESFMIHTLPRNILIGPDGRIIEPIAPPPSDPELEEMMKAYSIALNS